MNILHDENRNKFFVKVDDREVKLKYTPLHERLWDLRYFFIPKDLKNSEIKDRLIEYTLDFIKNHNIKIFASCLGVQEFLKNNKKYSELLYHPY